MQIRDILKLIARCSREASSQPLEPEHACESVEKCLRAIFKWYENWKLLTLRRLLHAFRPAGVWCFVRLPKNALAMLFTTARVMRKWESKTKKQQKEHNEFWWILLLARVVHLSALFFPLNLCPILLPETTISLLLRRSRSEIRIFSVIERTKLSQTITWPRCDWVSFVTRWPANVKSSQRHCWLW